MMNPNAIRWGLGALLLFALMGCGLQQKPITPQATTENVPAMATVAAPPASDWTPITTGVEKRLLRVDSSLATGGAFEMTVIRLAPESLNFRVHYTPQEWFFINEWQTSLPDAVMIVNASFFSSASVPSGLVVADGQVYGQSFSGFGGMFQVQSGSVRVRSLVEEPFATGEAFEQAVQGFPMLLQPGGRAARTGDGFDDPARRTLIAQDTNGRILVMITGLGSLTLRNAQAWLLAQTELGLNVAFGLDGGKSSGLYAADGTLHNNFDRVPVVLAAYPRE